MGTRVAELQLIEAMPIAPVTEPVDAGQRARPRSGAGEVGRTRGATRLRAEVETDVATRPRAGSRRDPSLAATIVLLARADLFRRCTPAEISELAATAYPMTFESGDALCVEGGESLECYVIAEGEAQVSIGERPVSTVGRNDVVGERGPLEDRTRTATVIAKNHMLTWAISCERLRSFIERACFDRERAHGLFKIENHGLCRAVAIARELTRSQLIVQAREVCAGGELLDRKIANAVKVLLPEERDEVVLVV